MHARHQSTSHRNATGLHPAARRMALFLLSGLSIVSISSTLAIAQDARVVRASAHDPHAAHIAEAAQRFRIPASWITTVMRAESAGNPRAISSAGAMGLMQIMPATWADLRSRHHLGRDPYDPRENVLAGAAYLRELYDQYGSPGFLAAYNAGPARYEASLNGVPMPQETRSYVAMLAPFIRGDRNARMFADMTANARMWTRAPLFIAPSERRSTAGLRQTRRTLNDAADSTFARIVSGLVPQSAGLFVAQTSEGSSP